MVTSRTGTAQYKHWRRRVLHAAQTAGITHCPHCHVPLDYSRGRLPNSAEPDHILPHKWGGRNTLDNGRVLCRRCNQSRGASNTPRTRPHRTTSTDVNW
nr:MAG TPA: HNH endonuclease [Caudoviricetes sp.]